MNTILSCTRRAFVIVALALSSTTPSLARGIDIDGQFDDWAGTPPAAIDPAGDGTAPFDLTQVFARSEGTAIILRFDAAQNVNIQAGPTGAPTLRVEVTLPGGDTLVADLRARTFRRLPAGTALSWSSVGYVSAPTFAAREFEVKFDLAGLGVNTGQTVNVNFSGSDSLAAPIPITLNQPVPGMQRRSAARPPLSALRIASINTLNTGLGHATRGPMFARMIDALDADIYCFQEEYTSSQPAVAFAVQQVDPLDNGYSWRAHKFNECALVTWGAVRPLPTFGTPISDYAAAVVDLGGAIGAVVVVSTHLRCCGWDGTAEDANRVAEMQSITQTINRLRDGLLGPDFEIYRDIPVIVVGDWNLVGSRTPLTVAETPKESRGLGLSWLFLRNLIGNDPQTWRDPGSAFSPGVLDLITYSADQLSAVHSFLFDTTRLNSDELAALGVEQNDSNASDHLMLVADFRRITPACAGDANRDGAVTIADLAVIVFNWGTVGIPGQLEGDADGSGDIDMRDVDAVLSRWGVVCTPG